MVDDSLKVIESKAQDLVIMFDSPKLFKLQSLFPSLSAETQKICNKDLDDIIVDLYYMGKHITKDIKVDLSGMGVRDTSFLINKAGKSYDEAITFKENEFLLKKAYQYFVQWFNCFNLYRMMFPVRVKQARTFLELMRKTRYTLNMFIERINSFKRKLHTKHKVELNKRQEWTSYVSEMIRRKGVKSNSVLRRPNDEAYYILGDTYLPL